MLLYFIAILITT